MKIKYIAALILPAGIILTAFNNEKITATSVQQLPDTTHNLFAAGTVPELISNQFSFTEGPVADKAGNVFFTDQPNNKIWKYTTDGKLSIFTDSAYRSNGLAMDKKGNIIACAEQKSQLLMFSPQGKVSVIVNDIDGKHLNGPNDVWVNKSGGYFFTDPFYRRNFWAYQMPQLESKKVYYVAKAGAKPVVVESEMRTPNGIVGTADGKYLFIADIDGRKIFKYTIGKNGTLTHRKLFYESGSDGMTLDKLGNLYICMNGGVSIISPQGKLITRIPVPEGWTANVCFGGKNFDMLFITASKSVFKMKMNVQGDR